METPFSALVPLVERQWRAFGRETPMPGLRLVRETAPTGIVRSLYRPCLAVVLGGAKISMLGETPFRYGAGQGLITSLDVPVVAQVTQATPERPYLAFSLAIAPALVADLLTDHGAALDEPDGAAGMATGTLGADLCDPISRLLLLLDSPRDAAVLGPLVQREIVWRLLGGPLGPALRRIGLPDGHAARIGRATLWIRDHYAEPLRVADLADLAHMSVSGFHRHFKAVTRQTPVQMQKQIRLQEARRLLLTEAEVAAVGYAIGYESPSQFSRDYRRLFGVPPGRDGAAIRASLTAEPAL